jgi:FMN reductase
MPHRRSVLAICASASKQSKTERVVDIISGFFPAAAFDFRSVSLRSFDTVHMLEVPASDPALKALNEAVEAADGIIVATPIYKASYTGLLKLFLDQLPQFALAGKAVMPLATGGSLAHVLALDYGLRPVLQSMGARHVVQSHFVLESDVVAAADGVSIRAEAAGPLVEAAHHFKSSIEAASDDRWLGHPRPSRLGPVPSLPA